MRAERTSFDWNIWLWWISLTTVGTIVALILLIYAAVRLFDAGLIGEEETSSMAMQVALAPLFFLAGAVVGTGQWLILRGLFNRAGWWILATAGGWMAGYLWSYLLFPGGETTSFSAALIPWVLNGLITGLCQWLILRANYERSSLWVPTAVLAMVIGTSGWILGGTFGAGLLWLAAGALSGWVLLRVLPPRRHWPEQR